MLENRETGKKAKTTIDSNGEGNYHLRDKRTKNSDGTYLSTAENPWEYAPKYGTYVILKGTLNMEINPDATNSQHLTADVVYHIHWVISAMDKQTIMTSNGIHITFTRLRSKE